MRKPGLYWRTVRTLTGRQLIYQMLVRLRGRSKLTIPERVDEPFFLAVPEADKPVSFCNGEFRLLNQSYVPQAGTPDWNGSSNDTSGYGKLWTYHLNYFDFLNQPGMLPHTGWTLMVDFMVRTSSLRAGLEPYPTSLRIMNWIQFVSRHRLRDRQVDRHLSAQITLLSRRLEYHLSGNHLLENAFALLMGSLYFRNERWLQIGAGLLQTELKRQILTDGGHYERSPVYHQALLDQLLTVLIALRADGWHRSRHPSLIDFLDSKACRMLNWLVAITFSNGDVPMVNDAACGLAPTTARLQEKVIHSVVQPGQSAVCDSGVAGRVPAESGYRMFRFDRYELFADIGPIGPRHQPGHAHADTFSFVLYADGMPLLVDTGTSTYQPGERRLWERGTAAHNTVCIDGENSSELWATFRVGRRAGVTLLEDTPRRLAARHDGYRQRGFLHERSWVMEPDNLTINDQVWPVRAGRPRTGRATARFHLHPDVDLQQTGGALRLGNWAVSFFSPAGLNVTIERYDMAEGFNRLRTGSCIRVDFTDRLTTKLSLIP